MNSKLVVNIFTTQFLKQHVLNCSKVSPRKGFLEILKNVSFFNFFFVKFILYSCLKCPEPRSGIGL